MIAWPAPQLPELPGSGPEVRLLDTATGTVRATGDDADAGLYVCGITPYDATHIGHAATYVAFDLLVRAWRDVGRHPRYVQNVTDVDDPLLERARATGEDWRALAERETALFTDDMAALRVVPPDVFLTASETVPRVVEAVSRLVELGAAYPVPAGDSPADWYFRVAADARFGGVSRLDRAQMLPLFAERGGDPDRAGKEDRLDALLWRGARDGEPSWDGGRLGPGRPGWHVECVAIALDHLGMGFDVQGGGSDLAFPHHEMGASHAHALTGERPYAQTYAHAGMVGLDGEKMSKSKGNLVLVSALRADGDDPAAIRLGILEHRYRDDWSWSQDVLDRAGERLARWREAVRRAGGPAAAEVLARVREHLADDLDAPAALRAVDDWSGAALAGHGEDPDAPGAVADLSDALLGVPLRA